VNIKEYIESGLLEAYVLGALSEQERSQVEADIARHPELAAEVASIETAMLNIAQANAKEVPGFMQDRIWNAIENENSSFQNSSTEYLTPPAPAKTIPLAPPPPQVKETNWVRAAVWVALAASALTNFVLLGQRNKAREEQLAMVQRVDSLSQQQKQLASVVDRYKKASDMLADTAMQAIVMRTMKPGHPMAATVYWSKAKGEAYVAIEKLPMPPKGMQYQMWVIQNGKPVDMGVLSNDLIASAGMDKMQMKIMDGQAFAISLEKEGGSPTPTAENIYVLGKVAS
jgi:anti-sigma-K factor RskA